MITRKRICHISHCLIGRAMIEQVTCFLEQRMASVRKKKSKAGETGRMRRHKIERERIERHWRVDRERERESTGVE